MKDSKGFMWFGTESGLNKYDGYEFVIYKNNPFDSTAISNNLINSTFEDGEGLIWIGTGGGGLNKFNRETEGFTHYRHNPQDPKSISSDFVFFAFEDKSNNIWVFTGAGGPCLIEEDRLTLPQMLRDKGYATACIGKWHIGMTFFDKDGNRITDQGIAGVKQIDYSKPIPDSFFLLIYYLYKQHLHVNHNLQEYLF